MVRLSDTVDARVTEMVLGHHERIDGTGYPRRLAGTEIPLFARIAGIVDTFDAITLNRRYAAAMSAHDALRYMNHERGQHFDAALVDEFVHALGVYPTGTRVQLADGRSGIVCAQNPDWPLRPTILLTHNAQGSRLEPPRLLPAGLKIVKPGEFAAYRKRMVEGGKLDGQFKTLKLTKDSDFAAEFGYSGCLQLEA